MHRTLMDIRRGETPRDTMVGLVEDALRAIDAREPWPLPDVGDADWLEDWLWLIRLSHME